jgi:hypothetical protein
LEDGRRALDGRQGVTGPNTSTPAE